MKKIFISIALAAVATFGCVAQTAQLEIVYDVTMPKVGAVIHQKMTMLASAKESKYFNEISNMNDSLSSTPEGKAKLQEIIMANCMNKDAAGGLSFDMSKSSVKSIYTYVFNNIPAKQLTVYDQWSQEKGYYTESADELQWEIQPDSTTTVLNYECVLAEADYHGRHWRAWFAPELPLAVGPWKFQGLPGVILRAESGDFVFNAIGLQNSDRKITPIYSKEEYDKVDRKEALKAQEYYKNNTQAMLRAQLGNTVIIKDSNGNPIDLSKFDGRLYSLETDYK